MHSQFQHINNLEFIKKRLKVKTALKDTRKQQNSLHCQINYDEDKVGKYTGGLHSMTFTMHYNNIDASYHIDISTSSKLKFNKTVNLLRAYLTVLKLVSIKEKIRLKS